MIFHAYTFIIYIYREEAKLHNELQQEKPLLHFLVLHFILIDQRWSSLSIACIIHWLLY